MKTARYVPHSPPVDLSTTYLADGDAGDKLHEIIAGMASDALKILVSAYNGGEGVAVGFPYLASPRSDGIYKGKPVDDPLIIYVSLDVGREQFDGPRFAVNLKDVILDEMNIDGPGMTDEEFRFHSGDERLENFRKIADHLRGLADFITNRCSEDKR